MSDLDVARLGQWLAGVLPAAPADIRLEKFPGGQSNPTYRMSIDGRDYVLRRRPFGPLLPSAHAVEREYRLISALHPTGFPVPAPLALCQDEDVIGSAFYVMELVEGRTFWNGALPDLSPPERRAAYEAMVDTLARLHSVDPVAVGLEDFGRPGNYFERQVARWTKQYRAAQTDDLPEVERLIDFLPRTAPEQTRTAIIHGDYRIDNLIYAPDSMTVRAVLDWELATLGDPLADFAYMAMNWILPADGRAGLNGLDLEAAGIPSLDDMARRYCAATGRDALPDLHWHFAFNLFRLIGIIQGVKKRMLSGNASSAKAADAVAMLPALTTAAWREARLAGAATEGQAAC